MSNNREDNSSNIDKAYTALKRGDHLEAWHLALNLTRQFPEEEEAWLILAALAEPDASPMYLKHALQINPRSSRAHAGMVWAIRRLQKNQVPTNPPVINQPSKRSIDSSKSNKGTKKYSANNIRLVPVIGIISTILLVGSVLGWFGAPILFQTLDILTLELFPISLQPPQPSISTPTIIIQPTEHAYINLPKPTIQASTIPTLIEPATTLIIFPTETPVSLITPFVAETLPVNPTPIQLAVTPGTTQEIIRPNGVGPNERWIDIDLSSQHTYALEGDTLLRIFLVSTGTSQTPTVRGVYKIYAKFRYDDMVGEDYNLADVPFVMYFYKDYSLHGTYWHHNFGHPMSHGCINMKTTDASWLYQWASIGTVVNIHR
jgi:lipoprotein-anchoring transpeptidase ErfK/SrfK